MTGVFHLPVTVACIDGSDRVKAEQALLNTCKVPHSRVTQTQFILERGILLTFGIRSH